MLAALEAAPWSPPDVARTDRAAVRELERRGLACEAGELWFATTAVDGRHRSRRPDCWPLSPDGFTVSEARQALGTTRKYAVPLLGPPRRHRRHPPAG